ncbi:DinB family protein [Cohnella luojiensis]|uniref:DinB family protein n=1 Tax=Cohnella luojiensis TaxID=652876 RepID=A0A4Y8LZT8_9BACL|nr:DinB family protein [Cohnella luojiensis]TFE27556.1 DinB family protein [Cohnella luojiensis]
METNLFDQMANIRRQTLEVMEGVTEELADRIPDGFRNNIRWHLGHVYTATEFLALSGLKLPMILPEGFIERFASGTSPLDDKAKSVPLPTLSQLGSLLKEQTERIREALPSSRLNESIPAITTSTGLDLLTPEQALRYNLYHEGLHFAIIPVYKKLLSR